MKNQPTQMVCGNNPAARLTEGDRQAVSEFRAYLADRAALRDRIADAIRGLNEGGTLADLDEDADVMALADAVLAVLPPPTDRDSVLREAAVVAESLRQFKPATGPRKAAQVSENVGILRVAEALRRMAAQKTVGHATVLETTNAYENPQDGVQP